VQECRPASGGIAFSRTSDNDFSMKNALFCRHCAKTEKGIFVCPLAGVLDKISFRYILQLES